MRLSDFFDFKKAPGAMVRLALVPLIVVIAFQACGALLRQLRAADLVPLLLALALASPLAYLIRSARRRRSHRQIHRRAAERTPLVPPQRGRI